MYSLSSNSSYCPVSSPDLLQQSLSLSAHVVEAPFGSARLNGSLVRHLDGSLEIVSKSAAFVMGERIVLPVLNKTARICYSIFTHIRSGFNRLDSAFGKAVALPQAEAAETIAKPIVSTLRRAQNCLSLNCPSIDKSQLHPRERAAIESGFISYYNWMVGNADFEKAQELLRFRWDDPRGKVLYLSAEEDPNGALAPETVYNLMKPLNKEFDTKYRVVKTYAEICNEIHWAAKIGRLASIIISGHGYSDSSGIMLSKSGFFSVESIDRSSDFSKCFAPLPVDKKIILISSYAGMAKGGDNPRDSFAQYLATGTKRTVEAVTDTVYPALIEIKSIKNMQLSHPQRDDNSKKFNWFSSTNLFREFIPEYPACPDLEEGLIDAREHSAAHVIDKSRFSRDFIGRKNILTALFSDDIKDHVPSFEDIQDHLRLCEDDPKSKFLFLSSKHDVFNELDPKQMPDFLSAIADQYDFKFKAIGSKSDICEEVSDAARIGEIGAVLIHSNSDELGLSSFSWSEWAYEVIFGKNEQFPDCLSKIPLSGRIILLGSRLLGSSIGSAVEGDPLNNLAYKIATITHRTVLASTEDVYSSKLILASSNPVEIYHPQKPDLVRRCFRSGSGMECSSMPGLEPTFPEKNSFLTFTPPEENDEL